MPLSSVFGRASFPYSKKISQLMHNTNTATFILAIFFQARFGEHPSSITISNFYYFFIRCYKKNISNLAIHFVFSFVCFFLKWKLKIQDNIISHKKFLCSFYFYFLEYNLFSLRSFLHFWTNTGVFFFKPISFIRFVLLYTHFLYERDYHKNNFV